jgi:F420H(2)-dependent quinone reductase
MLRKLGATRFGVWIIKHVVAPLDRWLYQRTGGKVVSTGKPAGPILLLTTTGRQSGQERTTPVFFLRDLQRIIICNVNPGFERTNPWVLNLRAHPVATLQIASDRRAYHAREATPSEVDLYWPALTRIWPAYQTHFERSGQRTIFILEEIQAGSAALEGQADH